MRGYHPFWQRMHSSPGTLYLVPNLLGIVPPHEVMPEKTIRIARLLSHFVAENAKSARTFLKTLGTNNRLQDIVIKELNEHTRELDIPHLLEPARLGHDLGLLSEAGCPAIADPGAQLIALAHREQIKVVPLVGPSAILLALMAAGMNGQRFCFHGYLPTDKPARRQALLELESKAQSTAATQLFIETPYRNLALLDDLLTACRGETLLCIAADLTLPSERIETLPLAQWRKRNCTWLAKRPALFLLNTYR